MPSWSLQPQGVDRGDTEDIKNYIIEHVKVLSAIKKSNQSMLRGLGTTGFGVQVSVLSHCDRTERRRWQQSREDVRKLANMESRGRTFQEERQS